MLRPGLQALLADALAGRFTVLIAEALDRLSHDQADVAAIYKRLTFAGVRILTLSEGWIEELHVGLKGTMNQLYLKDLAATTRRGLRGRVEAGFSGGGNAYGYRVVRRLKSNGELATGQREIDEDEARIVRRIFAALAADQSPKAIAKDRNRDRIPGYPLARHCHPRPSPKRHRHPEQRALPRSSRLEPAALCEGSEHRQTRLTPE
jgi:site-specific DNA recombinase